MFQNQIRNFLLQKFKYYAYKFLNNLKISIIAAIRVNPALGSCACTPHSYGRYPWLPQAGANIG